MTALSAEEVLKEAQFAQRLLKTGASQVVSINEDDTNRSSVSKNGVNKFNYLSELIELEDGSCWI
jgi:hypothetical protein